MKRFTHLLAILMMLGLGMGLSQALHHAVAHPYASTGDSSCGGHCSSAHSSHAPRHHVPPADPSHHPDDCAVCAVLASTKTPISTPLVSAFFAQSISVRIAPRDQHAPRPDVLRPTRSRAPPPR